MSEPWKLRTHVTQILQRDTDAGPRFLGTKDLVLEGVALTFAGAAQAVVIDGRGGVLQSMPLVQIDTEKREVTVVAGVRVLATDEEIEAAKPSAPDS